MSKNKQTIEVGDQFLDLDKRLVGPRVVKVIKVVAFGLYAQVENVEHWNEELLGRRSHISQRRLRSAAFKRVSR